MALHVNGNARIQAGDIYLGSGTAGSATDMRISYGSNDVLTFIVGTGGERMRIANGGNVGIATTNPTAKLHVGGDVKVDGNIAAKYQDVAEWVTAREPAAAGTVMVISADNRNVVQRSERSYDTGVAGVVSPKPGIMLGETGPSKALVAQSGRVVVNVDARYGAIRAGDLLVTSPTPGHAMRSQSVTLNGVEFHRPGTILGKALEPLDSKSGQILMLLTLQ